MFVQVLLSFSLIHFVTSNSIQEDLSISNYSHIGCLTLNPDKQLISNGLQENFVFPYQSFSSPNLTIDLCFRLCRRWMILTNNNHTNCICLYTLSELYEINEYLGEVLPVNNCTTNALKIYSLTKDPHILPSLTKNDDWSFDGCYRMDGLRRKPANISLTGMNYTLALDLCGKYCPTMPNLNYVSFFLSFKKLCYCLPMNTRSINTTAIRKPLIHCSFLPYVKKEFDNSFNESSVHVDTVVKILVHHSCSSSFSFDRKLYLCSTTVLFNQSNSYLRITPNDTCSPISVKTIEQYNHLISLPPSSASRTFIWINRNSTYLFDDKFRSKVNSLPLGDLCLVINRTQSTSYDLVACSTAQPSDYNFCTQKPMAANNINQSKFESMYVSEYLHYSIFVFLDKQLLS